jgi:hypothetical protein
MIIKNLNMKNTDILSRITALLNKKVSLAQMSLENGTVVESDSFAVGDPIFAIDGENKVPLEIGKYTMEDGSVLEVYEIGIVGEIAPASAEEVETKSEEEMAAELASVTEVARLAEDEKTNDVILKVVEALKPVFDELNSKIENLSKVSSEVKETLSKVTEKTPLKHKPTEVKLNSVNTGANLSGTEARIMAMLSK